MSKEMGAGGRFDIFLDSAYGEVPYKHVHMRARTSKNEEQRAATSNEHQNEKT